MPEFALVILTGGRSQRMGSDKATVQVAGRPMGHWVRDAARAALRPAPVLVLGRSPIEGLHRFDDGPGIGPLAGIAGVEDAFNEIGIHPDGVVVVAVDHPWVRPDTIRRMAGRFVATPLLPIDQEVRQVTCAIYPMDFIRTATNAAHLGAGFQRILDGVEVDTVPEAEWRAWGEDGRSWFSVNRPTDIASGLEHFGPPTTQHQPDRENDS